MAVSVAHSGACAIPLRTRYSGFSGRRNPFDLRKRHRQVQFNLGYTVHTSRRAHWTKPVPWGFSRISCALNGVNQVCMFLITYNAAEAAQGKDHSPRVIRECRNFHAVNARHPLGTRHNQGKANARTLVGRTRILTLFDTIRICRVLFP